MTATTRTSRQFVFEGAQAAARGGAPPQGSGTASSMTRDTPAVQYLRNFSNYLIPRRRDWLLDIAVLMRGWTADMLMVSALVSCWRALGPHCSRRVRLCSRRQRRLA